MNTCRTVLMANLSSASALLYIVSLNLILNVLCIILVQLKKARTVRIFLSKYMRIAYINVHA